MIKLENVSKIYKMGDIELKALDDVSLTINEGEFVAIIGPSGSGKSTLMNIIGFLDVATKGSYHLEYEDVTKLSDSDLARIRNDKIGFIFQSFNLLSNFTATGNVELPLVYSGKKERINKAEESLKKVGLYERKDHRPKELSGGQQQRVAIARALANKPSIIMADEPTGALDSKTGVEIMNLLQELNDSGITVILVTHDHNVANYANRVIEIKDGKITRDESKKKIDVSENQEEIKKLKKRSFFSRYMLSFTEILESFYMSVYSIFTNKMRTFLTMLGVIIGVASVIAMTAIGAGAQKQVTDNISSMGANLLMIYPGSSSRGPVKSGSVRQNMTYDEAIAIKEQSDYVELVDVSYGRNAQVVFENKNTNTRVEGVSTFFPQVRNFQVELGSFFTEQDNRTKRRVAVIGKTVREELFGDKNPIGEYIKIRRVNFQVVGVLKEKGSSGWRDEDDTIVIPIFTAQKRLYGVDYVSAINASIISNDEADAAIKDISSILRKLHKIQPGQPDDFNIRSQAEIISMVGDSMKSFTFLLAGIAVVSLVVGGIGIMNIMLVSVTERTREIGIRKAIGARRVDIMSQFLIEAILVSVTGGILGIFGGYGIGVLVSKIAKWETVVSMDSVAVSFLFALFVGLFFGFYPALKASKLNPIDALRYE